MRVRNQFVQKFNGYLPIWKPILFLIGTKSLNERELILLLFFACITNKSVNSVKRFTFEGTLEEWCEVLGWSIKKMSINVNSLLYKGYIEEIENKKKMYRITKLDPVMQRMPENLMRQVTEFQKEFSHPNTDFTNTLEEMAEMLRVCGYNVTSFNRSSRGMKVS